MSCDMNKIIINFYVYEINIGSLKSSPETNVDIQQIEIIIGYHGDELEKFLDKFVVNISCEINKRVLTTFIFHVLKLRVI